MHNYKKIRNRHLLMLDVLLLLVSPTVATVLRIERIIDNEFIVPLIVYTFGALGIRLVALYAFGLYRRFWRYASTSELSQIFVAVAVSTGVISLIFFTIRAINLFQFPRSVLIIDAMLVLMGVGFSRFAIRYAADTQSIIAGGKRVVVMGAGDAGAIIVKEIMTNHDLDMNVVGILDDDLGKHNVSIHGVPVLGGRELIPRLEVEYSAEQVIIAMPTASGKVIREIVSLCESAEIETKTMPGMYKLLDGTVSVNQIRDVDIEDLLRREPVETDITAVQSLVKGQKILITGAGGSIGGELCHQIIRCEPSDIILLGHGENSVFGIANSLAEWQRMQNNHKTIIHSVIADVRFYERVRYVFDQYRPNLIFHAAAHKHVPLMEQNSCEAITNNVLGTRNLLNAALENNVERFVMISTDKAVSPTNVMGASKRTAELLVHQAAVKSGRPYVAVRFGNVLGSRGSVVHTFKRQIATGGPVTVVHPEVTRYFMTIPEAVQLLLQSAVMGRGKEVFVLDMGEPVKIMDLARDLIELSGLEVERDIDIEIIGLRPGDKLYEELFIDGENYTRTAHHKIFIAANASELIPQDLDELIDAVIEQAQDHNYLAMFTTLRRLVPKSDITELI